MTEVVVLRRRVQQSLNAVDSLIKARLLGEARAHYPEQAWCIGNLVWKLKFRECQRPTLVSVSFGF